MTEPIVTIRNGKLRGKISKNYDGGQFHSFLGIPFAKPPIGPLKFKAPLPAESWEGIKDATKSGSNCLADNMLTGDVTGSEDCLYLNVYTQELPEKSKSLKPVMVWIHGGAFTLGSGSLESHGPDYLMTKDVVIVTINYRLGLLGFLNFEDPCLEVPGNAGLKDQVLALKWVQDNIRAFSGDPNNVTVFGLSAGGASVHYLMLSPLTKGLFHKCILQSGCVFCPWAIGNKMLPYLTEALQIETTNESKVLEMLQKMSSAELMQVQKNMKDTLDPSYRRCLAPVVEPVSPGAFLTEDPEHIILSGNYNQVPMIIGFASREGVLADFFNESFKNSYVVENFETLIPFTMNVARNSELSKSVANKIKKFYYGEQPTCEDNKLQFYLISGDSTFEWPIIKTVKLHAKTSNTPIYLYQFSADAKFNMFKQLMKSQIPGAAHGDDFSYLFKCTEFFPVSISPKTVEEKIMRNIVKLLTSFAISGNPNLPGTDHEKIINWNPVDGNSLNFLDIRENLTVGINPDEDRMKFWEDITSQVNDTKL